MFAFGSNGTYIGPNPTTGTIPAGGGPAYTSPLVGTLNFFHFHSGVDAALVGAADNAKQGLDPLWSWFNGLVTPLNYSRMAYWGIGWTPQIGSSAGDMQPVLDMRCMRCRIFDGSGNQIGYRFTTNPIWHMVDAYLRRAIKPQYSIDSVAGPDPLTTYELNCFRWDIIAESAAYCDFVLPNGQARFSGSYAFASGTTLAAIIEQMLLCCRGYKQEIAGKIALFIDQPRSSLFTVTGNMLVPGTFQGDDTVLHPAGNRYVATFLETGLPAISTISTISRASNVATINTVALNPCAANDLIIIGGVADSSFDQASLVSSVTSAGVITAGASQGGSASSTGGYIGYLESRFAKRSPEAPPHLQHQLALGQVLPPSASGQRLKRIKVEYNYANTTWDQAMRLILYERYRDLGPDAAPYKPPMRISLTVWSEAVDAAGNMLWDRQCGDVITLDPTTFYEFAGNWEILEFIPHLMFVDLEVDGASSAQPASNAGTVDLVLWAYDPARFIDNSGEANASFATVPGAFLYSPVGGTIGTWYITGGTFTVIAGKSSPSDPSSGYSCRLYWYGITAVAPDGTVLSYADGSGLFNSEDGASIVFTWTSTDYEAVFVIDGSPMPANVFGTWESPVPDPGMTLNGTF